MTALAAAFLLLLAPASAFGASPSDRTEAVRSEAAWIVSLQNEDGNVLDFSRNWPLNKATPYFANMALSGFSSSFKQTFECAEVASLCRQRLQDGLEPAKKYMRWYLSHLNKPDVYGVYGTVYDFVASGSGELVSRNDYDSADSYAATFISLVRAYYEAGGDKQFLLDNRAAIDLVPNAMVAMLDKDNLTFAKPNLRIKYLMDNSEVQKGFADMAYISRYVFQDEKRAAYFQVLADRARTAVLTELGNGSEFYVYKTESAKKAADWSVFYPDAVSQLFPIVNGFAVPSAPALRLSDGRYAASAKNVYEKFNLFWPGWSSLSKGDEFPWAMAGYAAALMGDSAKVDAFFQSSKTAHLQTGREHPWHIAESAFLIKALGQSYGLKKLSAPPALK